MKTHYLRDIKYQHWLSHAYSSRRYAILFYSLLATLAAGPLFDAVGLDADLLELFLAANVLLAVIPTKADIKGCSLLAGLFVAASLRYGAAWFDHRVISIFGLALWAIVALLAAAGALRFAARARSVDSEHLYAALDAYLLAGIFLGVLYWILEHLSPGSFAGATDTFSIPSAIYFSFVTLATLGYGDIVPRNEIARGVAIVEAVAGQLYLAVMIARLVSLYALGAARDNQS
jgi:voltage-gated potassium channel